MRSGSAYIASFSTTGLLLVLALVVLVVFGALMAFRGGIGPDRSPPVNDVVIDRAEPAPERVAEPARPRPRSDRPAAPSTEGVVLTVPAPVVASPPAREGLGSSLQLSAGGRRSAPGRTAPVGEQGPGLGAPGEVGDVAVPVSPQTGDALDNVLEQVGGLPVEERVPPLTLTD